MSNIIGQRADPVQIENLLKAAFNQMPNAVNARIKDIKMMPDGQISIQTEVQALAPLRSIDFMEFSVDMPQRFSMQSYLYTPEKDKQVENGIMEVNFTASIDY